MELSRDVVRTLCRRLCAAAQNQQTAAGAESTAEADPFPLKLQANADVVAVYRLDWPETLSGRIAAPPSLRVNYARIELKARPTRVLAYYRRQLPGCEEHAIPGGGWLDSLSNDKQQTKTRSTDVFVAKTNANVSGVPDQDQELSVDILSIECEHIAKRGPLSASR
jgi:hypothetical protein